MDHFALRDIKTNVIYDLGFIDSERAEFIAEDHPTAVLVVKRTTWKRYRGQLTD